MPVKRGTDNQGSIVVIPKSKNEFLLCFTAGMSNSHPPGRMRLLELLSAAPETILQLLMNFGSIATDNCRTNV